MARKHKLSIDPVVAIALVEGAAGQHIFGACTDVLTDYLFAVQSIHNDSIATDEK